jgi:hypothetical protein
MKIIPLSGQTNKIRSYRRQKKTQAKTFGGRKTKK